MTAKPKAPAGLAARGKRLWTSTVDTFVLRDDELVILTQLCRTVDLLDRLEVEVRKVPLTITGSKGQERLHPVLAEVRAQRLAAADLCRRLGLDDVADSGDDGKPLPTPKQVRARNAAQARWGHRGA